MTAPLTPLKFPRGIDNKCMRGWSHYRTSCGRFVIAREAGYDPWMIGVVDPFTHSGDEWAQWLAAVGLDAAHCCFDTRQAAVEALYDTLVADGIERWLSVPAHIAEQFLPVETL